jgi:hypothetical protein
LYYRYEYKYIIEKYFKKKNIKKKKSKTIELIEIYEKWINENRLGLLGLVNNLWLWNLRSQ